MDTDKKIYEWTSTGAGMWSKVISRGKSLKMTDVDGGANVSMLLYNAYEKEERYNMPDTLKGQYIFYLTSPYCIHSDMGRLFASITEDTFGWHDTACGVSDAELVEKKYGARTFQEARNDFYQNGRDSLLIELGKWGLGKRDLVPNINWFSKVVADDEGVLTYDASAGKKGASVTLKFELDTLVVLNTCQHPLDTNSNYKTAKVKLEVFGGAVSQIEDPWIQSRPENIRAYENTRDYNALRF